jgi:short-subunit dehydrogenase
VRVGGRTWVVTGAGSGIGQELTLLLLQRGARVAAVDRSEAGLRETADRATAAGHLSTHVLDITDRDAVESLVAAVTDAHGDVDGLVNNAGIIQPFVPFLDLDDSAIERVLNVNLMGTIFMTRAFLPLLLDRPQAHLVNVSSMGGFFPFPNQTMYGASKAAVKLLTEGLFAELHDTGVKVSVVMPGPTRTAIATGAAGMPEPSGDTRMPMTEADDAARMIIEGVEKGSLHIYLGTVARLANLAIRVAPRQAILFVRRQMQSLMLAQEPTPTR